MTPDCIIFSCGRAGSTSLYRYVDEMAKLGSPENKEPHFWLGDTKKWRNTPKVLDSIAVTDTAAYKALYANSTISIDASVAYYHHVSEVTERLAKAQVSPKAVMLVRDPINWAKSLHVENVYQGLERERDLAVCLSEDRSDPSIWWQLRYTSVRYIETYEHLRKSLEHVLLIDHATFETKPERVLDQLCKFLAVEPSAAVPNERHHNRKDRLSRIQLGSYHRVWKRLPAALKPYFLAFIQHRKQDFLTNYNNAEIASYLRESIISYEQLHKRYREDFVG